MKKILLAGALALSLLSGAYTASAANWINLGPMGNQTIWAIDSESIQRVGNTRSTAWVKIIQPDTSYVLHQYTCDFTNGSYALISGIVYDANGTVRDMFSNPSYRLKWQRIVPNSPGAVIYTAILAHRQGRPIQSVLPRPGRPVQAAPAQNRAPAGQVRPTNQTQNRVVNPYQNRVANQNQVRPVNQVQNQNQNRNQVVRQGQLVPARV